MTKLSISFFVILITNSMLYANTTDNLKCSQLANYLEDEMIAQYTTLKNFESYLNDNAVNWKNMDQAFRKVLSSARARRNTRYSGQAANEARKSSYNSKVIRQNRDNLKNFIGDFAEQLRDCIDRPSLTKEKFE